MQLELEQVSVVRRGRALLDRVSLTLAPGQLLALVGPNGAGKSTLLRVMLGLTTPNGGRALCGKADVHALAAKERAARVAWLPQQAAAAEDLSALDVVTAARFRFAETFAQSERAAQSALERVRVAHVARRAMGTLSGGERQRVALAAALAQDTPILLVDEPANHLDPAQQIDVYRLLGELWRAGKSLVCVTHDINLLRHLGNAEAVRVAGMAEGALRFTLSLTAPELPTELGALFGVRMHAFELEGERVLLPERTA